MNRRTVVFGWSLVIMAACGVYASPSTIPGQIEEDNITIKTGRKKMTVKHFLPHSNEWFHDYPFPIPLDSKFNGVSIHRDNDNDRENFYIFSIGSKFCNEFSTLLDGQQSAVINGIEWKVIDAKFIDSLDERPVYWIHLEK